ncbi:hypothetical protein CORC01_14139 [Colletotrichum orchidophilum]|uniref:Uncharacterized protein n=1 Tax=Colletotrichum orchidophilum TaxID=1209926 RepID=A0A1G4ANG5_9PEZI|nr:uncharacterized protein CORC01_14139 [Colletotrichum orchidophilum]OHE90572.1 hypothetical protein CORC01_14139 [Colletotrichum orchidophilum]
MHVPQMTGVSAVPMVKTSSTALHLTPQGLQDNVSASPRDNKQLSRSAQKVRANERLAVPDALSLLRRSALSQVL